MSDARPNPDELLRQVQASERAARRGSLRIYFGYAAGVGKTYAMLEAARRAQQSGRQVLVGYVEPHARPETLQLLEGLETLSPVLREYRGVTLREFDIDAALARRPELLLVDELAHTNAHGCRHAKRWQDVEEALAAGIDVWSTLNVQHLESLNDVVGQVTGVIVRETVPDRVFAGADEIELVDLPPEDLLDRLRAGKIYLPEQARRAVESFFQRSNLAALRELSLRQTARRVHSEVEEARRQRAVTQPWATSDRLLVCVGPSPTTARVIRAASRLASALDAPWLAVSVDVPGLTLDGAARHRVAEHFRIAERLGAETATVSGADVVGTILDFARSRNVTKLVVGKTQQSRWLRYVRRTVVDRFLEESGEIDVYVIRGEEERSSIAAPTERKQVDWLGYAMAAAFIGATTAFALLLRRLRLADAEANTVMLLLAAVAWVAFRSGRGPAVFASILAVASFDFLFVPPSFTLAVADAQYLVTFAVMLAIGLLISELATQLRRQVVSTRTRERRTAALYELGKQLSSLYGATFLVTAAARKIVELTGGEVAIYLRAATGPPEVVFGADSAIVRDVTSNAAAQWVIEHDQMAGAGTNTLPGAAALLTPLTGSQRVMGAMAVRTSDMEGLLEPDQRRLLEACAFQLALALERDQLAIEAAEARIKAETEQVRNTLLTGVSHDLKTPLAAIAGAGSSLLESTSLDETTRRQLAETVVDEATRLNRLLENILQMSRIESGAAAPARQWHVVEELVGSALQRVRRTLEGRRVEIEIAADLPLISVDGLLLEQVLVNLLDNAVRYSPGGEPIQVTAGNDGAWLRIAVADRGPGIPPGEAERIFEKFYRGRHDPDAARGSGLGLAICRAIVEAHGGTIRAANRPDGGAEFVVRLPLDPAAPRVVVE